MTGRRWGNRPPDLRVLGLLTAPEAALMLGTSVRRVRALAAAGELERAGPGRLVRVTPESVAAYRRRLQAGAGTRKDERCPVK